MRRSDWARGRAAALLAWAAALAGGGAGSPEAWAADAAAGRQKAAMCQTCHGLDGVGRLPDVPHIAGENTGYLVRQLDAFRSGERRHEQMSIIAAGLSDDDIADLAAWYSSIEFTVTMPE
jgi:cytochrome c553